MVFVLTDAEAMVGEAAGPFAQNKSRDTKFNQSPERSGSHFLITMLLQLKKGEKKNLKHVSQCP